ADRNRFGKYGTFLNHIGIVTLLGAAVLGGAFGWRDDGFMVPEGSTRTISYQPSLSVRSDAFVDEYYPNGTAKDFRSDLVVLENGNEVARKTIRVNDPLEYKGIRIHQAFFGPSTVMRVTDPEGKVIFEDGVALGYEFTGGGIARNGGFFTLNNRRLAVYVLVPAAQRGPDPDIPAGSVRLEIFEPRQAQPSAIETLPQGEQKQIMGHTFEFLRERQFSGLQVAYNPAINAIWFAAACMIIGTIVVFHFPLRRLWVRIDTPDDAGTSDPGSTGVRLRVAAIGNRDILFAREFETLALTLEKEVVGSSPKTQDG
ncbi:MAG TPA: cytochrome c biogenesis protein ResB, partial [Chloroflexota bacterium]|nr:cytochrome c biogenesis protein ResB [Chloroflexota bacterium]